MHSPDYKNMDKEEALQDFLRRIHHYEVSARTGAFYVYPDVGNKKYLHC